MVTEILCSNFFPFFFLTSTHLDFRISEKWNSA
uniref:Uncharacterized protein n=1 Tax=Rhizophora mucronata TaxID=61149 RepID=A0A2P2QCW9_RHIMU